MPHTHQLEVRRPFQLPDLPPDGNQFHPDRESAEAEFKQLRRELIELQNRLYAEGKQKLLIVFQAMDAGGKDGTIRRVFRGVNPQGVRVHSFKAPSKIELAHDYLWRIHNVVPAKGMIGVFNRSHYEDVLVVRVHDIVPESVWRPRYEQINQFEKLLNDTGAAILKFFLHISPDEQKERFQDRLDEPSKNWKFSLEDLEKRKFWGDYMTAYEEMLQRCTTDWAPWYVIPANQKWYRNLTITRTIVDTLKQMDPQYPEPEGDLSGITID
ncbi:MAG: polyphosphate kinase 2 family protein [Chloroflexi bacterium]|nr:polyphosphate kinase 2 family protein [Chloroflexota bacterium]